MNGKNPPDPGQGISNNWIGSLIAKLFAERRANQQKPLFQKIHKEENTK
jgi:hypothetical protein